MQPCTQEVMIKTQGAALIPGGRGIEALLLLLSRYDGGLHPEAIRINADLWRAWFASATPTRTQLLMMGSNLQSSAISEPRLERSTS